ncbi:MAG: GntR family transcriptional regulator [Mycoplasmatales bacterium]
MKKYLIVADDLREKIIKGTYTNKLPTENQLVEQYNVSKITIKHALNLLVEENIIFKQQGSGIYIKEVNILSSKYERKMHGFKKSHINTNYRTEVFRFRVITCPHDVAELLQIEKEAEVYEIIRVRYLDNQPNRYEHSYIPVQIIPKLTLEICADSIYEYITNQLNLKISRTHDYFSTCLADDNDYLILDVSTNEVMVVLEQLAYLDDETRFQYSITKYNYRTFNFKNITYFD